MMEISAVTNVSESAIPIRPPGFRPRLDALDLLRGAIMIIMALDHVRDFLSRDALSFDPTDLQQTHAALFLTRWITHFCAPVFFFLAGTGAYLSLGRGKTKRDLSWFLLTRGLWLVLLELTLVQWGWNFRIDPHFLGGAVIWALGWSMVFLSLLVYLPVWGVAAFGIAMITLHNLTDSVSPAAFGPWGWLWKILHVQSLIEFSPTASFGVAYPLIPWIGVMAAGFGFGALLRRERAERRKLLLWLGCVLTLLFVIIRATNVYGDPSLWSRQPTLLFTVFSFVNTTKYPPSLLYLLMTLGPAIIFLGLCDRDLGHWVRPVIVFGRVPLFFYLLHIPLIHGIAVLLASLKHGAAQGVWLGPPWSPEMVAAYPKDYGYGLGMVYLVWAIVILVLYPLCHWFADLKQRRRDAWLSYF